MSDPKPGELWIVDLDGRKVWGTADSDGDWFWIDPANAEADYAARSLAPIRRLIVLDPESAEDVERVRAADEAVDPDKAPLNYWRDLLRNLANPPEPEMPEPTALGAVVVDGVGVMWVRTSVPGWEWTCREDGSGDWDSIPRPVRLATDEERGA